MKINCNFSAQVLATNKNVLSDGRTYFNVTLFVPSSGEAGQLNISESLFNELIPGSTYDFKAMYNDKYKNLSIVGVENE